MAVQTDYMTKVQQAVVPMIARTKKMVKDKVFLGPGLMKLDPQSALTRLEQMTPEQRRELVNTMGQDEFMNQVESLLDAKEKNARRK